MENTNDTNQIDEQQDGTREDNGLTATYSPEDNKLRLYSTWRLSPEIYERVKQAGFRWAPKQNLFVAPMWTPSREDLLNELCGTIEDEDKSLVERATERAERFEGYNESRTKDAENAREAVKAIADRIPFGQPILIGHHSERRARKDADRIHEGMRKAIRLWETAEYWTARADGALHHAKYKELPAVRARRIKTLEAERRKLQRAVDEGRKYFGAWAALAEKNAAHLESEATRRLATELAGAAGSVRALVPAALNRLSFGRETFYDALRWTENPVSVALVCEWAAAHLAGWNRPTSGIARWLAHYENRLAYERAMLGEAGGIAADRTKPEKGGAVVCWASHRGWSYIVKVNRVTVSVLDNWGNGGRNFTRNIPFDKLQQLMTAAEVEEARAAGRLHETPTKTGFYLVAGPTDNAPGADNKTVSNEQLHAGDNAAKPNVAESAAAFDELRESLRQGVQVVIAPQLLPTPDEIADSMVDKLDVVPGLRYLEPSAGTGRLLHALGRAGVTYNISAVELNNQLCDGLRAMSLPGVEVLQGDFLEIGGQLGKFDRILLNPPFANAIDIEHIELARSLLATGGQLVALCAAGPRQERKLRPLAEACGGSWELLPDGSFAASGTQVRVAMLTLFA